MIYFDQIEEEMAMQSSKLNACSIALEHARAYQEQQEYNINRTKNVAYSLCITHDIMIILFFLTITISYSLDGQV
jgi:hypothetical protein